MKLIKKFRLIVGAAALLSLTAFSSQVLANGQVNVAGAENGQLVFNNKVQVSGIAADPEGIKVIYATIQNNKNKKFLATSGTKYSSKPKRLNVQFDNGAQQTRWATEAYTLSPGSYTFRLRLEDNGGDRTDIITVPFRVDPNAMASNSDPVKRNAQVASQRPPGVAVQFPKNGAVMNGVTVFRGVAKDDQAVTSVVGTIMNTDSGLYLGNNGRFGKSGQFALRTTRGQSVQWTSPEIQLPPGNYLFSAKGVDNNGLESNWSQVKFSVAGQAVTAQAPVAMAAGMRTAANGMNYCGSNNNDPDGDGYGWENNASCIVEGSRADKHPNCASSASDPDGDGYGWENERSCIVVTHCKSAASDPDGDGYGWENQRSCVVMPTSNAGGRFPSCASAASDPDGDGYGWENNKTCLVGK